MFYYSYFTGHGRVSLAHTLGTSDPFGLEPCKIIERILAAGFRPVLKKPKTEPWRTIGPVSEVAVDGQTFLIAVAKKAERISIQEVRADAYPV